MRVVIATDAIGALSSIEAGELLGSAWAARGAEVAVVPMAAGGAALTEALDALAPSLAFVDLTSGDADDIAPGIIGVVEEDQLQLPLTGLHGLAAVRGRATGQPLADVLAEDARLAAWAGQIWPDNPDAATVAGGGAHGGMGLRVLAAGGSLTTGAALCAASARLAETAKQADVVVSGCDTLDFGSFGGPVVAELIGVATAALRPLVVVAGRNHVSSRELRSAGIEAAYAARRGDDASPVTADELAALGDRVAASWSW